MKKCFLIDTLSEIGADSVIFPWVLQSLLASWLSPSWSAFGVVSSALQGWCQTSWFVQHDSFCCQEYSRSTFPTTCVVWQLSQLFSWPLFLARVFSPRLSWNLICFYLAIPLSDRLFASDDSSESLYGLLGPSVPCHRSPGSFCASSKCPNLSSFSAFDSSLKALAQLFVCALSHWVSIAYVFLVNARHDAL